MNLRCQGDTKIFCTNDTLADQGELADRHLTFVNVNHGGQLSGAFSRGFLQDSEVMFILEDIDPSVNIESEFHKSLTSERRTERS